MRLLLVEDEVRLAESLVELLKRKKYSVDVAFDGEEGQYLAETGIYDLIILDRMLPIKDGICVLKEIRSAGIKTPVIFLTAKDTITARVEGLDAGADDYLVKPFAIDELLARIRALIRRKDTNILEDEIIIGKLVLDTNKNEVKCNDENIKMTFKEYKLLEFLMRNKNIILTKDQIFEKIWGLESEADITCVENYIFFLRKKIDFKSAKVKIETKRNMGYSLKEVLS